MILGAKPWVLREIGREIRPPFSQRTMKARNRFNSVFVCFFACFMF